MGKKRHEPEALTADLIAEMKVRPAPALDTLLAIMAKLRAPDGCPWDREQDHRTLRYHAVEEVYELLDAIDAGDDREMAEELGDLLLQVVFHCQLARERGGFDFEDVCQRISEKLIRRHPHVFGDLEVKDVDTVWANWDKIKRAEKEGSRHARPSALDGIPKRMPSLMRAEKLVKKARKAGLFDDGAEPRNLSKAQVAARLFELAVYTQRKKWNAEDLLRGEIRRRETRLRSREKRKPTGPK